MALRTVVCWNAVPQKCSAADNLWLHAARATITSHELHAHVGLLADDMLEGREAGSRGGHAAAKYLLQHLQESGLQPAGTNGRFSQPFHGNFQNLLALLPGSDPDLKHETLVVGAHFDHVGYGTRRNSYGPTGFIHNGADDNASGVATLLEVIDAFAQVDHRPRRSILFAFWDGEEKGLLGSKHWIRNPTVPLASVRLAVNIDMVGRLTKGRIEVMGSRTAAGLRRLLSTRSLSSGHWVDFTWEYKDNSDHWTFFEAGFPSLCLHTGLHDDYHRPSDDAEKINIEGIREVSGYLLEQISTLADADQLPGFRAKSRSERPSTQRRVQQPLPPLTPRLDFTWTYLPGDRPAVQVTNVSRRSNAAAAGLQPSDTIFSVNGLPTTNEALLPAIALQSESEIYVTLSRTGFVEPVELKIPLAGNPVRLGLSWREDPAEPQAVYVTRVVPYSPAARAGFKLYDRIYALDGKPIQGQEYLLEKIRELLASDTKSFHVQTESRGILQDTILSLELPSTATSDPTL